MSEYNCQNCGYGIESIPELAFENSKLGLCPSCREVFIVNGKPLAAQDIESMSQWIHENNPLILADIIVDTKLQPGGSFLFGESLSIGQNLGSMNRTQLTSIIIKAVDKTGNILRVSALKTDIPCDVEYKGMVCFGNTSLAWTNITHVEFAANKRLQPDHKNAE